MASPPLREQNEVLLTRDYLRIILDDFSVRLLNHFGRPVRLIIHGGAVMVLHRNLAHRVSTRDVDFCLRAFIAEWHKKGVYDAEARLNVCIKATAAKFGLGIDWMNSHADVALPLSRDKFGHLYDPIYRDAVEPNNVAQNTVYSSPGLILIGVSWSWAVALKLVRYKKDDPYDIACILLLGQKMKGLSWDRRTLEGWLLTMCSPMGYHAYAPPQMEQTRERMRHAIKLSQDLSSRPVSISPNHRLPAIVQAF